MARNKKITFSLLGKYQALLIENDRLKAENEKLKSQLAALNHFEEKPGQVKMQDAAVDDKETPSPVISTESIPADPATTINQDSKSNEKIKLFMSLFRGREDVYAKRWQNINGKSGYAPACFNEWKAGICEKPRIKCSECSNKAFEALHERVVKEHLTGKMIAGIYPMCPDDGCWFLAIDFDDEGWEKDISTLRAVCSEFDIPFAAERSRSGNGAHIWFFFAEAIAAASARKFGTAILTHSMNKRHEIKFKSYDRFFPNQDTTPKGGFGNLIALPLQALPRKNGNSVFIDEHLKPYPDQWEFLSSISKLSEKKVAALTTKLSAFANGIDLGVLRKDDEGNSKPWERTPTVSLTKDDFPETMRLVRANMIFILKQGVSQRALNALKRLAAFKNPEFYKAQAIRLPTYNKPRIISCSDETEEYLCLPRGCESGIMNLLNGFVGEIQTDDKTNHGRSIEVDFKGRLQAEQSSAVNELLEHDIGVLAAATAFGKTVVAAKLIAERKTNTLVIVHRKQLLTQWIAQLSKFLSFNEELSIPERRRGRQKLPSLIGHIGGGGKESSDIIDVAIMQSLYRGNEISERVQNYGMVIVDECHHVPAFSFEQVLRNVHAKYVYGLTATPERLDGHHPIIFMQCGPVRFKANSEMQSQQRVFDRYVIPRFTGLRIPIDKASASPLRAEREPTIQELYSQLSDDEMRNQLIVDDVVGNYESGRSSLLLTERVAHVELLIKKLSAYIPDVISLTGGTGARKTRETFRRISDAPADKPLTLVATGKYIGEGFDEPRLDTLFLAMPISWKGTLQQYVGRLHRIYKGKKEVRVYDYVDIYVRMLENMYNKRLKGYASFGYKTKGEAFAPESANFIFDKSSFYPVYCNDIANAQKVIFIISPFVRRRRVEQIHHYLKNAISKGTKVTIITRPSSDLREKDMLILEHVFDSLKDDGIDLQFRSGIHQKFAVIDQRIVWYGSINLLGFGNSEETMMRLQSSNIASELMRSVEI